MDRTRAHMVLKSYAWHGSEHYSYLYNYRLIMLIDRRAPLSWPLNIMVIPSTRSGTPMHYRDLPIKVQFQHSDLILAYMCNQGDMVDFTWIWNFQPTRRHYITRMSDDVRQASLRTRRSVAEQILVLMQARYHLLAETLRRKICCPPTTTKICGTPRHHHAITSKPRPLLPNITSAYGIILV